MGGGGQAQGVALEKQQIGFPHISHEAEYLLLSAFGLSTQLTVTTCIHTVLTHAPAVYSNAFGNTTAVSYIVGAHAPAVLPGCLSYKCHLSSSPWS